MKTDEKYRNIEGDERSPSGRKTSLQVFKELQRNKELKMSNRKELETHMQDGTRPFYGFPHMNFDEVIPKGPVGIEYHHERMGFKWRVMSRSITQFAEKEKEKEKEDKTKTEVEIIIEAHHEQIKRNQVFMKALQQGKKNASKAHIQASIKLVEVANMNKSIGNGLKT